MAVKKLTQRKAKRKGDTKKTHKERSNQRRRKGDAKRRQEARGGHISGARRVERIQVLRVERMAINSSCSNHTTGRHEVRASKYIGCSKGRLILAA